MMIPKTFKVGSTKYTVTFSDTLPNNERGHVYYSGKVVLAKYGMFSARTPAEQFETLIHEMVHAVLHDMDSPHNKEKFVEPFAKRLAAAFRSARF